MGEIAALDYDSPLWTFFLTPSFAAAFVVTFLCPYVLSPALRRVLLPNLNDLKDKTMLFHSLLGSTLHSVVSFSLAVYIIVFAGMGSTLAYSNSKLGMASMQISFGYFVADFCVCLLDPYMQSDLGSLAHHLTAIFGIGMSIYLRGQFMFFVVYRLIAEFSTPFVNWRFLIYMTGGKEGVWYIVASLVMMLSFFLCRIVLIPWHWYMVVVTLLSPEAAVLSHIVVWWSVVTYLVFDIINIYWISKMVKGAVKIIRKKTSKLSD